jgi:acetylornithine deacetylase
LPADHPPIRLARDLTGRPAATAPFGTDASELQALAPCVVPGPGSVATAHTPCECAALLADLDAAVPVFARLLEAGAARADL